MPLLKKTKIVATLGPASESEEVIRKMMLAGTNVFRINFSHADHDDVAVRIKIIRKLSDELKLHISILGDLQGPKLRVGVIEEGAVVRPGDLVEFNTAAPFEGNAKSAYMTYQRFPLDVNPGERVLLDDGKLIFEGLVFKNDRFYGLIDYYFLWILCQKCLYAVECKSKTFNLGIFQHIVKLGI